MVHVRFPKLGEACTAFYNEPGPKVTIGVVSVTELRAPEGIGPDVKTHLGRGTLHIEFERRSTPRTCLPGLLFDWDENMARDCNLFQPLDINFVQDSKAILSKNRPSRGAAKISCSTASGSSLRHPRSSPSRTILFSPSPRGRSTARTSFAASQTPATSSRRG